MFRRKKSAKPAQPKPIVDVIGLVDRSGVGYMTIDDHDDLCTMNFRFEAWRIEGAKLEDRRLHVFRDMTQTEFEYLAQTISPFAVIRIKAQLDVDWHYGCGALFESFAGLHTSDDALNAVAEARQNPPALVDTVLGTLYADHEFQKHSGQATWLGQPIRLTLAGFELPEVQSSLPIAHEIWSNQDKWNQLVRDYAERKLLDFLTKESQAQGNGPLSAASFHSKIKLTAVHVGNDGQFKFWFDDGWLLGGHSISILCDLRNGPKDLE